MSCGAGLVQRDGVDEKCEEKSKQQKNGREEGKAAEGGGGLNCFIVLALGSGFAMLPPQGILPSGDSCRP